MLATWILDNDTVESWRKFVSYHLPNEFVQSRVSKNVRRKGIELSRQSIWFALVLCQITTQQKSGPNSNAAIFLRSKSPALSYETCKKNNNVAKFIASEMTKAGLRRASIVSVNLERILNELENGEWNKLESELASILTRTSKKKEQIVSAYLQGEKYPGLGPKQSRNFMQWLGLSRYEIPIDSRFLTKLRNMGCSYVPAANALSDEHTYRFLQSGIQELASAIGVYPCVLDACVFSSFDHVDA